MRIATVRQRIIRLGYVFFLLSLLVLNSGLPQIAQARKNTRHLAKHIDEDALVGDGKNGLLENSISAVARVGRNMRRSCPTPTERLNFQGY